MNVRLLNKTFSECVNDLFLRQIFFFIISRNILIKPSDEIRMLCQVAKQREDSYCYYTCCPLLRAAVSHCKDSRAHFNIHIALGATVALFSLTVFQTLTFSISLYKHKKESLISLTLPIRSISFQKVLTPTLRPCIRYACDYTLLNTQKGYFAINHKTELFLFPLEPFKIGHVESWKEHQYNVFYGELPTDDFMHIFFCHPPQYVMTHNDNLCLKL